MGKKARVENDPLLDQHRHPGDDGAEDTLIFKG